MFKFALVFVAVCCCGVYAGRLSLKDEEKPYILGETVNEFVNREINSDKVVIFSKTVCFFSYLAKLQFEKLNHPFKAIEVDVRADADLIINVLFEMTGRTSLPRVFVNGKFIGGGQEVERMYEDGSLEKLLRG